MKAILVPVDGLPRSIEVEGLKDLQRAVGGCIESCSWIFNDEPAVSMLGSVIGSHSGPGAIAVAFFENK